MKEVVSSDGINIRIVSAFRSVNYQIEIITGPQGLHHPKQIQRYHLVDTPKPDKFYPAWRNARP